jgi:hypothetical protein
VNLLKKLPPQSQKCLGILLLWCGHYSICKIN